MAIMGSSAGAAVTGMRPIAEIMYDDFLGCCMDQLMNQAAKFRYMYGGLSLIHISCLNVGCIPTKALMKNVEILHYIDAGKKRGIKVKGELELDYAKAVKAKDKAVKQLVNGVTGLLGFNEITMYQGCLLYTST